MQNKVEFVNAMLSEVTGLLQIVSDPIYLISNSNYYKISSKKLFTSLAITSDFS